ncbi:MAG: hypothetical protein A3I61_10110 [Acidobacteria bacterium RIFCSPLOWO2_02_FULL_68_18]|nr:MAG: hypothetical protein A3I61_10110 [Acidobacteria bacterium RIFCSPLOWO2_02_FULL_68_18]
MLPALLLASALLGTPAPQAAPPPTYEEAVALARRGEFREALDLFRRIVAAAPGDHDSRVWLARLLGFLGRSSEAEAAYRGVLGENPKHVDAMVGLGGTLVNRGRYAEALEVLASAESLAPANPDVLGALARAYRILGRTSLAVQYIERAVAIAPTGEQRLAREQILRAHAHRVESTGFLERFTFAVPQAWNGDVAVNLRVHDRMRISARGQWQDKFHARETRAGGGIEWRWPPRTTLAASVLTGPGNTVLPRTDVNVEASHARGRAEWLAGYRYIGFPGVSASVVSPGMTFAIRDTIQIWGRYYLASTSYAGPDERRTSHSGAVRGSVAATTRLWLSGGYARGTESFETLSPDRIGEFDADTVFWSVRVDLPGLTSLAAGHEHQWRSTGTGMDRVTLSLVQRF